MNNLFMVYMQAFYNYCHIKRSTSVFSGSLCINFLITVACKQFLAFMGNGWDDLFLHKFLKIIHAKDGWL